MDSLCHVKSEIMYSRDKLFMYSLECYFGVYFSHCFATQEIYTKITLSWVHKLFATRVHSTSFSVSYVNVKNIATYLFQLQNVYTVCDCLNDYVCIHSTNIQYMKIRYWLGHCILSFFSELYMMNMIVFGPCCPQGWTQRVSYVPAVIPVTSPLETGRFIRELGWSWE